MTKMAPVRLAAVLPASDACLYLLVLSVIFNLLSPPVLGRNTYDRQTLLNLGTQYSNCAPMNLNPDPTWLADILRDYNNNNGRRPRRKPRGKRAGVWNRLRHRAHHPPLPSILHANVQSLKNKLDELRARIKFQRDIRDCNVICLTETWLNPPDPGPRRSTSGVPHSSP